MHETATLTEGVQTAAARRLFRFGPTPWWWWLCWIRGGGYLLSMFWCTANIFASLCWYYTRTPEHAHTQKQAIRYTGSAGRHWKLQIKSSADACITLYISLFVSMFLFIAAFCLRHRRTAEQVVSVEIQQFRRNAGRGQGALPSQRLHQHTAVHARHRPGMFIGFIGMHSPDTWKHGLILRWYSDNKIGTMILKKIYSVRYSDTNIILISKYIYEWE